MMSSMTMSDKAITPPPISESYLLLQIHRRFAKDLANILSSSWTWCGSVSSLDSGQWHQNGKITAHFAGGGMLEMRFIKLGYDPTGTTIKYGTPKSVPNPTPEGLAGHDYIFDLKDQKNDGHFSQTDEVTLERSREVATSHVIMMDATASASTTVGGSVAGIGLETEFSASFGYSDTQEETEAKGESQAVTETHTFDITLPAGKATRVRLVTDEITTATPMDMIAVPIWTVEFALSAPCVETTRQDWWDGHGPKGGGGGAKFFANEKNLYARKCRGNTNAWGWGYHITPPHLYGPCWMVIDIMDILSVFKGTHVDWQGMQGWWDQQPPNVQKWVEDLWGSDYRQITMSGTQTVTGQFSMREEITDITNEDINALIQKTGAQLTQPTS